MSTFNVCRLSAPLLVKSSPDENGVRGIIINTSGFLATEGNLTQSFMSGTFGAINSMTLPLSRDLADNGIRVVTISPGKVRNMILMVGVIPYKSSFLPLYHLQERTLGSHNGIPYLNLEILVIKFVSPS